MNRLILLLLPPLLLTALAGCPATKPATTQAPTTTEASNTRNAPTQYAFLALIKITSIEVPVGTASGSEEIWSYLDEERTKTVHSATLGRNGLRVGMANASSWPDLARILQKMTGQKISEQSFAAIPGQPFQIELKNGMPPQTIFTSYSDRTLSGADYPAGDNLLAVCVSLDENDSTKMIVTAIPQIRSTQRVTDIVREQTGLEFVDHPITCSFIPATFQIPMTDHDIMVIGPGAESRRPTSLGYHFLLREKRNMLFETVLVLAIDIVKAPLNGPAVEVQR